MCMLLFEVDDFHVVFVSLLVCKWLANTESASRNSSFFNHILAIKHAISISYM
jgi:hypothetical protein